MTLWAVSLAFKPSISSRSIWAAVIGRGGEAQYVSYFFDVVVKCKYCFHDV